MIDAITKNLGDKADYYLGFKNPKIAKERLHVPGADWVDRIFAPSAREHRLSLDPPGRPGHRARRRRQLRQEPRLLRRREHRQARHRGRLQRRRLHLRRPGHGRAPVRPPDPLHGQGQPQRAADLSQQGRPDPVRHDQGSGRHGLRRGRRHDLLRLRAERAADRRGRAGLCDGPRAGHGDGALVLHPQQRVQEGQGLPRLGRPDRPGERRTSSSRSCRRTTAASRPSTRAAPATASSTSASTPSSAAITRSISAATRSPTATWAARA